MSSSDIAVSVRGLSKSYTIVSNVEKHITLAETLLDRARNMFNPVEKVTFRALQDIEFDIRAGEVVGFIGRNGAGKSTLLKVLSEITEPTAGEVRLFGRVGSLLEVGTGFHPELTGRENVYLNGAILGMSRGEITRQFDAIVDFAEVETFLDTPVKRYSSGMYVRLAFAVAAHLNPEILIVDEVLAVGDAAFQRKCLGKMEDVAKTGRTVLFVSHNMDAVRRLCSRGILLEHGQILQDALSQETVRTYFDLLRKPNELTGVALENRLNRHSCAVRFAQVAAMDANGKETWDFEMGDTIRFRISYKAVEAVPSLALYMAIRSCITKEVLTSVTNVISSIPINAGEAGAFVVEIPNANLRPGSYSLYIAFGNKEYAAFYDVVDENVNLPILCITTEEQDPHRTIGYFSLPSRILFD